MVGDAGPLGGAGLGGADVHAAVEQGGVGVDDLGAGFRLVGLYRLGEVEGQGGLAGGRGAYDDDSGQTGGARGPWAHGAQISGRRGPTRLSAWVQADERRVQVEAQLGVGGPGGQVGEVGGAYQRTDGGVDDADGGEELVPVPVVDAGGDLVPLGGGGGLLPVPGDQEPALVPLGNLDDEGEGVPGAQGGRGARGPRSAGRCTPWGR